MQILQGDCIEQMANMPDKSFDFAFVDPPYNVGKDYGGYKDNLPEAEYFEWCEKWISELKRVCSRVAIYPPKKHLLWFWNQVPENHQVICAWSPEGAIRSNFKHHYISLLVPRPVKLVKDHWWNVQVPGLGYFYREEKFDNPGQTSFDVTNRIIEYFTMPGEKVLDCFMGVGTTGIASVAKNRDFTGIEINPYYCEIAERRIKDKMQQPTLEVE